MKQRIWELDAFRGLCILGMVAVHFVFDLVELYGLVDWQYPLLFSLVMDWGGVLFLVLSGICVTLGSHPAKRGLLVFCCGMLVTGVTAAMALLGLSGGGSIIYFGVLHCLGCCMLLWCVVRNCATWVLGILGAGIAVLGLWLRNQAVATVWLIPLGLTYPGFSTPDYFPILPYFGFFLLGAALGQTVYRNQVTQFPKVNAEAAPIRFLRSCGQRSLWIYLLHQPVLTLLFFLWMLLF